MRSLIVAILLLLSGWNGVAQAELLVASLDNSAVLRYDDRTGAFLGVFAAMQSDDHPISMTVGPDSNLYVSGNTFGGNVQTSFIRRFDGKTGAFIDTFASGAELDAPADLVFGSDGNLYVAIFGANAVSKVIRYNGNTGAYMDDFVPAGSGGLRGAEGMAFGPDGNLYVTSRVTNQILRYDGSTGEFLDVFATGGENGPIDLVFTFGPDGHMYVLNSMQGSSSVLRFDGETGEFLDIFVSEFTGGTDGTSLVFGPDRNLYVSTGFIGNSVRRFNGRTGKLIDEFVKTGSGGLSYATGLLFTAPISKKVRIDIKPGRFPNNIDLKSKGKVMVAILSNPSFDAAAVDPATVRFGATGTEAAPVQVTLANVDGDRDKDMILTFTTRGTGIQCGDTSASLTAKTVSGEFIMGTDSIKTVGCMINRYCPPHYRNGYHPDKKRLDGRRFDKRDEGRRLMRNFDKRW